MLEQNETGGRLFPIRELSVRTRVNTVTLRAWERRYGLLKPQRTTKGHRLYAEKDVVTVKRVLALAARGVPIGKVKPLLQNKMPVEVQVEDTENWHSSVAELVTAVGLFSVSKLEHLIQKYFAGYPVPICRKRLFEPVFAKLALRDDKGAAFVFTESELIRYVLMRLSARIARKNTYDTVMLIAGTQTPIWRLALMALELADADFAAHILTRPVSPAAGFELADKWKNTYTVFYQDGVWKDSEKELAVADRLVNERLFLCGTAPGLTHLNMHDRVFADLENCIGTLLNRP